MQSLFMVIILLGLLTSAGCQSSITQQGDVPMEPESSPSITIAESSPIAILPESSPDVTVPESRSIATISESSSNNAVPESSLGATPSPDIPTVEVTKDRQNIQTEKTLERVPLTVTTAPVNGEVPNELLESVVQDLAQNAGVEQGRISVVRAQSTVWNDGSLGCPQPGLVYIQVPVKGYWIELMAEGQMYDYRATETGNFFMCENGFLPILQPGGTPVK